MQVSAAAWFACAECLGARAFWVERFAQPNLGLAPAFMCWSLLHAIVCAAARCVPSLVCAMFVKQCFCLTATPQQERLLHTAKCLKPESTSKQLKRRFNTSLALSNRVSDVKV